jgi:hypothetical protein
VQRPLEIKDVRTITRQAAKAAMPSDDNAYAANGPQLPGVSLAEVVNSVQAAKVLGVTPKTLANWRALKIGVRYIKYGGRCGPVRYRLSDLLAWQEARTRKPNDGGSHA